MRLTYAIKYVTDMERSVAFHRDVLNLQLKFQSPSWSEFLTGDTTLALHIDSPDHPPGSVQLGYAVADLGEFYAQRDDLGIKFTQAPTEMHGAFIARFRDLDGGEVSISGPM